MNSTLNNPTVLVVDDSADALSLINDTLETANINTLVALDGKQALSVAKRMLPDMILLDALMPNMDGFETCRQLKADPALSAIPVIFMTGLTDTENTLKGLEAGGVDYLTKPVNPNELLARMKVHLANARATNSAHQALDSIGQNIFTVSNDGKMLWGTPHTHALFAKASASKTWLETVLPNHVKRWLDSAPYPSQKLKLADCDIELNIVLLEKRSDNEWLLRLEEAMSVKGEEVLKVALSLTTRESEVLFWIANGKTNKEISEILGMGVRTVNKHLEQVFPKLGVENRTAAAGIAIRLLD